LSKKEGEKDNASALVDGKGTEPETEKPETEPENLDGKPTEPETENPEEGKLSAEPADLVEKTEYTEHGENVGKQKEELSIRQFEIKDIPEGTEEPHLSVIENRRIKKEFNDLERSYKKLLNSNVSGEEHAKVCEELDLARRSNRNLFVKNKSLEELNAGLEEALKIATEKVKTLKKN